MNTPQEAPLLPDHLEAIYASDLPAVVKLARAFRAVTAEVIADTHRQVELARAMGDGEELIKQQIKGSTMETALRLFEACRARIVEPAAEGER